jgi:magnesium chelatase family protein
MTPDEALHVTRVYSAAGKLAQTGAHHTPDHAASSKATATRAGSDPTTQAIPSSTASPAHDGSATATAAHDTPDPIADLDAATADHAAHDDDAAIAGLVTVRPVRAPHHTASSAAVIGGGIVPKPGEISLAHRGVLFLDELPEFPRSVLDTLRQPLESGDITISRAHGSVTFPARFMLVAAMNPTAKGDMPTDAAGRREMERYLARVSRPLIDRIDIHVEAPAVPWKQLTADAPAGESSTSMRTKVLRARRRQRQRQGQLLNSELTGKQLNHYCPLTHDAKALLGQAITELGLSARAYDKVRRIALTIADLDAPDAAADGEPHADDPSDGDTMTPVGLGAVAEAIQYRLLDRRV